MERPEAPRRKSSTSEIEELPGRQKAHRKTFVVGAAKSHHRIPSYGKKLNQLGKLTALTSTEPKGPTEAPSDGSRRASFHRSSSQRSLGEGARRSSSTQNLQKLRRSNSQHGSTAKLTNLKPMTKVGSSSKLYTDVAASNRVKTEDKVDDSQKETTNGKRATFMIEDDEDDEEESEDVASSFAKDAFIHEKSVQDKRDAEVIETSHSLTEMPRDESAAQAMDTTTTTKKLKKQDQAQTEHLEISATTINAVNKSSSGLLYNRTKKLVDPLVSTDPVVSHDIQMKERPQAMRSMTARSGQSTPINSQPLTSRFLESPRKDSMPTLGLAPSNLGRKENLATSTHQIPLQKVGPPKAHHSPHGSTTNLGLGSSRTQQKLLLQRASSIRDINGELDSKAGDVDQFSHPRCQKELDRISREYKNAKRFRDPLKELSFRLYARGLAVSNPSPLRRTMTQTALNGQVGETKNPKTSQSTADLKHRVSTDAQPKSNHVAKILQDMWLKDDHKPTYEE